jgi:hypothetical protein
MSDSDMPIKEAQGVIVQSVDDWQTHGGTAARDRWLAGCSGPRAPERNFDHTITLDEEQRQPVVIICPDPEPTNMILFHSVFSSRWVIHVVLRLDSICSDTNPRFA